MLEHLNGKLIEAIDQYDANRLLNTSVDELSAYFASRYAVEVPKLIEDGITADGYEADVDVSLDFDRAIIDRSRPYHIKGLEVIYHVPYEGDGNIFGFRPSSWSMRAVPDGKTERELPRIVRTVFPFGFQFVRVNPSTGETLGSG